MKYSSGSLRQTNNIYFKDPVMIKNEIEKCYIDMVHRLQTQNIKLQQKVQERSMIRHMRAQSYLDYHSAPKLFTYVEVEEMNAKRQVSDPPCPEYLTCFMTNTDYKTWTEYTQQIKNKNKINYKPTPHLLDWTRTNGTDFEI